MCHNLNCILFSKSLTGVGVLIFSFTHKEQLQIRFIWKYKFDPLLSCLGFLLVNKCQAFGILQLQLIVIYEPVWLVSNQTQMSDDVKRVVFVPLSNREARICSYELVGHRERIGFFKCFYLALYFLGGSLLPSSLSVGRFTIAVCRNVPLQRSFTLISGSV